MQRSRPIVRRKFINGNILKTYTNNKNSRQEHKIVLKTISIYSKGRRKHGHVKLLTWKILKKKKNRISRDEKYNI